MVNNPATRASIHSGSGEIFFTCTSPVPRYVPGICNIWLCVQQKKGEKRQPLEAFPSQFSGSSGSTVLQGINLLSLSFPLCPQ